MTPEDAELSEITEDEASLFSRALPAKTKTVLHPVQLKIKPKLSKRGKTRDKNRFIQNSFYGCGRKTTVPVASSMLSTMASDSSG